MIMKEIYKALIGYEKSYEISNFGNVRSVEREMLLFGKQKKVLESQTIKTRPHCKGYRRFTVWKNGILDTIYVHRAVAIAFLSNPNKLEVVNHKDLNKENNNIDNLEWASFSGNTEHYYDYKNKSNDF